MLNKRYIKSIKRDSFCFDFLSSILVSIFFCVDFFSGKYWKRNVPSGVPYKRYRGLLLPELLYVIVTSS